MAELDEFAEEEHSAAGRLCADHCDAVFAVGPLCEHLVDAARSSGLNAVNWFQTKRPAAEAAVEFARPGDHLLVKASRGHAFETIIPLLETAE